MSLVRQIVVRGFSATDPFSLLLRARSREENILISGYKRYRHGVSLSATSFASRNSSKSFPSHFPRWVTYLRDLSVRDGSEITLRALRTVLEFPFLAPTLASYYFTIDALINHDWVNFPLFWLTLEILLLRKSKILYIYKLSKQNLYIYIVWLFEMKFYLYFQSQFSHFMGSTGFQYF